MTKTLYGDHLQTLVWPWCDISRNGMILVLHYNIGIKLFELSQCVSMIDSDVL